MPKAHNRTKDSGTFEQHLTAQYICRRHAEKLKAEGWTANDVEASVVREWDTPFMQRMAKERLSEGPGNLRSELGALMSVDG
jgi:hypothetical protein